MLLSIRCAQVVELGLKIFALLPRPLYMTIVCRVRCCSARKVGGGRCALGVARASVSEVPLACPLSCGAFAKSINANF